MMCLPHRNGSCEDLRRTWTNATASGHENHAAEQRGYSQYTVARHSSYPEMSRWIVDLLRCPVASSRDDEGVSLHPRLRNSSEAVPFKERILGTIERSSVRVIKSGEIVGIPVNDDRCVFYRARTETRGRRSTDRLCESECDETNSSH